MPLTTHYLGNCCGLQRRGCLFPSIDRNPKGKQHTSSARTFSFTSVRGRIVPRGAGGGQEKNGVEGLHSSRSRQSSKGFRRSTRVPSSQHEHEREHEPHELGESLFPFLPFLFLLTRHGSGAGSFRTVSVIIPGEQYLFFSPFWGRGPDREIPKFVNSTDTSCHAQKGSGTTRG